MPFSWPRRLFETKGFYRIQPRGPVGRIEAETDSDGGTNQQPCNRPAKGENKVYLQPKSQKISTYDPESDPK